MSLWVVKIGTSLLRGTKDKTTTEMIYAYCDCLAENIQKGEKIILVTSGSVGLGSKCLELSQRPEDVVSLQAAAAIGQGHLMSLYQTAMAKHKKLVAQILITRSDLEAREKYQNASNTLRKLLEWGVMPIVNENDTLSQEELRFGDNDTLSALVATAVNADQLILLTDVDRLYSSDPRKNPSAFPITDVHNARELNSLESKTTDSKGGSWGTGGITTKLAAARIATQSGITVHLADGRQPNFLNQLLNGTRGGTVFHPSTKPLPNKKSWLAHALKPIGALHIDEGASNALINKGASLLLVGIKKVEGEFTANQPVKVINQKGEELARGLCSLSSNELLKNRNSDALVERSPVVMHRDVMVITRKETGQSSQDNYDPPWKVT